MKRIFISLGVWVLALLPPMAMAQGYYAPTASSTTVSATTTSGSTPVLLTIPLGGGVLVQNTGAIGVNCALGGPGVVASSSSPYFGPGQGYTLNRGASTYIACVTGSSTATVYATPANGSPVSLPGGSMGGTPGGGTVTSVGLALPSIFSVTGSPVTGAGTLTATLATESANTVFAGPGSGSAAQPTFRSLVAADIPSLSSTYLPLTGGTVTGNVTFSGLNATGTVSGSWCSTSAGLFVYKVGANCEAGSGGVTSFSGDGALLSNSSSTGAVTATLANAGADTIWGNATGSSAASGYTSSPNVQALGLVTGGSAPADGFITASNILKLYSNSTLGLQLDASGNILVGTGAGVKIANASGDGFNVNETITGTLAAVTGNFSGLLSETGTTTCPVTAGQVSISGISTAPSLGTTNAGCEYLTATGGMNMQGAGSSDDVKLNDAGGNAALQIVHSTASNPIVQVQGPLQANNGLTASAGSVSLNNNSNFLVNIGTGTDTQAVTIGGASNTVNLPGIASSSAAQTGTVCLTIPTGNLTVDTTTTCLLSDENDKKDVAPLTLWDAVKVLEWQPVSYHYKPEFQGKNDPNLASEQVGFTAQRMAKVDRRLMSVGPDGQPHSVRYQQAVAILTKAVQVEQWEIFLLILWCLGLTVVVVRRR